MAPITDTSDTLHSGLSRGRVVGLTLFVAFVVGMHVFDLSTYTEHWPSSRYSMYNFIAQKKFSFLVIYGVKEDGSEMFASRDEYVYPFLRRPLNVVFENLLKDPQSGQRHNIYEMAHGGVEDAKTGLRDVLARYERRRVAGDHDGPKLKAMRLYEVSWTVQPDASNREQPDEKTLLFEVEAQP